tara:strand:+ start:216 stop:437 length:222 start_codon:yes stop_codon:yes gene_type:complete
MEQAIEKMKAEYDLKIDDCDKMIGILRVNIAANRRDLQGQGNDTLRVDRAIEQAKRQAYVQAKYDFDSLLDYV